MKKIIICIIILLLLTSCSTLSSMFSAEQEDTINTSEPTTEADRESVPILPNESAPILGGASADLIYMPLESLLKEVTDIVEAKFLKRTTQGITYQYQFEVTENLRGLGTENIIQVSSLPADFTIVDKDIEFSTYDCRYNEGARYLLLLKRSKTAYDIDDSFSFVEDSLVISLTRSGKLKSPCFLYGGDISWHFRSEELLQSYNKGEFIENILSLCQNNPLFYGEAYEGSADMKSVIQNSDFVFEVTVKSVYMETFDGTQITYTCTLDRSYKGSTQHSEIAVKFPHNQDIIGQSFIVAVNELEGTDKKIFLMSSPHSIFDISQRDAVIELIESEAQ